MRLAAGGLPRPAPTLPACLQASILLFDGRTLDPLSRLDTAAPGFHCLAFTADCRQLLAGASDGRLLRFSMSDGAGGA